MTLIQVSLESTCKGTQNNDVTKNTPISTLIFMSIFFLIFPSLFL